MKIAIMSTFPAILAKVFINRHYQNLERKGVSISSVIIDTQQHKRERKFKHAIMIAKRKAVIANCSTLTSFFRIIVWKTINRLTYVSHNDNSNNITEIITPVRVPTHNSEIAINEIRDNRPDLICLMGARILTRTTLEKFDTKVINIHSSDPRFIRGGPEVVWEVLANRTDITLTIHEVIAEVDAGAILLQEDHPITYGKGLGITIQRTMHSAEEKVADLFFQAILRYKEGSLEPQYFSPGQLCVTPKIRDTLRAEYLCRKKSI